MASPTMALQTPTRHPRHRPRGTSWRPMKYFSTSGQLICAIFAFATARLPFLPLCHGLLTMFAEAGSSANGRYLLTRTRYPPRYSDLWRLWDTDHPGVASRRLPTNRGATPRRRTVDRASLPGALQARSPLSRLLLLQHRQQRDRR